MIDGVFAFVSVVHDLLVLINKESLLKIDQQHTWNVLDLTRCKLCWQERHESEV